MKPKIRKPTNLQGLDLVTWCLQNTTPYGDCLVYNGTEHSSGYFQIKINYVSHRLHRYIYCVVNNEDYSSDFLVRHICNNKNCINPNHLVKGSASQNRLDSRSYHKGTVLSEDIVKNIRKELESNKDRVTIFDKKFAKLYNVSTSTIKSVRLGINWSDVRL